MAVLAMTYEFAIQTYWLPPPKARVMVGSAVKTMVYNSCMVSILHLMVTGGALYVRRCG